MVSGGVGGQLVKEDGTPSGVEKVVSTAVNGVSVVEEGESEG